MMMMGSMLIVPLLLVGVVAYLLGVRPQSNETRPPQSGQTPSEILKARYARGEITHDVYEQMRQDLAA
jgi:uncharacterized membrane protein